MFKIFIQHLYNTLISVNNSLLYNIKNFIHLITSSERTHNGCCISSLYRFVHSLLRKCSRSWFIRFAGNHFTQFIKKTNFLCAPWAHSKRDEQVIVIDEWGIFRCLSLSFVVSLPACLSGSESQVTRCKRICASCIPDQCAASGPRSCHPLFCHHFVLIRRVPTMRVHRLKLMLFWWFCSACQII